MSTGRIASTLALARRCPPDRDRWGYRRCARALTSATIDSCISMGPWLLLLFLRELQGEVLENMRKPGSASILLALGSPGWQPVLPGSPSAGFIRLRAVTERHHVREIALRFPEGAAPPFLTRYNFATLLTNHVEAY